MIFVTIGLEYQPISFTIETVMSCLATRHSDHTLQKGPISNARILCKWEMVREREGGRIEYMILDINITYQCHCKTNNVDIILKHCSVLEMFYL